MKNAHAFLVAALMLFNFSSAYAGVKLTPIAYSMTADGPEAQNAFAAMKAAGITANPNGGFNVSAVEVSVESNDMLDPTDPCFKHTAYRVSFKDDNKIQKIDGVSGATPVSFMNSDRTKDCGNDPTAQSLAKVWTALGGRKVTEDDMGGESDFSAGNISCVFLTHTSQYFCDGSVGN